MSASFVLSEHRGSALISKPPFQRVSEITTDKAMLWSYRAWKQGLLKYKNLKNVSRISQSECSSSGEHFPLQAEHSSYYLPPPGHYPGRALEKMRKLRPGPHVFLVTASRILWLSHEQDSKAGWPALGGQWPHAQRCPAAIRIGAEPMLTFFLSFPTPSSKNSRSVNTGW